MGAIGEGIKHDPVPSDHTEVVRTDPLTHEERLLRRLEERAEDAVAASGGHLSLAEARARYGLPPESEEITDTEPATGSHLHTDSLVAEDTGLDEPVPEEAEGYAPYMATGLGGDAVAVVNEEGDVVPPPEPDRDYHAPRRGTSVAKAAAAELREEHLYPSLHEPSEPTAGS